MDDVKENVLTQTLDVPLRDSKEGVLTAFLELRLKGSQIIATLDGASDTDRRLIELIDWMISGIPNIKFQQDLRKKRDARVEKETKGITDNTIRGRITKQINREIAGEISVYMDKYTGGERVNRLSFVIPRKEMKELLQSFNPDHFQEQFDEQIVDEQELMDSAT